MSSLSQLQFNIKKYKETKHTLYLNKSISLLLFYLNRMKKNHFLGLNTDEQDDFISSLFFPMKNRELSVFEYSLRKYRYNIKISFFTFFMNIVFLKFKTVLRKKNKESKYLLFVGNIIDIEYVLSKNKNECSANGNFDFEEDFLICYYFALLDSIQKIKNELYRNLVSFLFLYPCKLSRRDIGLLFDVKKETINSSYKRALKIFFQNLKLKKEFVFTYDIIKSFFNSEFFYIELDPFVFSKCELLLAQDLFLQTKHLKLEKEVIECFQNKFRFWFPYAFAYKYIECKNKVKGLRYE